jgi:hypothetical protein
MIEGIGKLKLGSSPSVLSEIGYDLDKAISVNDQTTYFRNVYKKYMGNNLYQLFPDQKNKNGISDATYHPSVKVYYIPKYEPVESLICQGITLKYFNDSLYYIKTENPSKLEDAFKLKYGKPEIDLKEEDKYYVNGLGIEIVKTDKTFKMTYETGNPETTCVSTLMSWHDSKGKQSSMYYLILSIPQISNLVRNVDEQKNKEIKEQQEKDKLKNLDGL